MVPVPDTDSPQPILVVHGTRSAEGVKTVARLSELVSRRIGPTRMAFVDVLGPSPSEALREITCPALVIPAFLASGYHVRRDIPEHIAASGHSRVLLCDNLGPDPVLAEVMVDRLRACGWRRGDAVVMAAAGSSDPHAVADLSVAAGYLGAMLGDEVAVGYAATGTPRVTDVVDAVRRARGGRVFLATYLLAPGLFHSRLQQCGADGVAAPLGADPRIAARIAERAAAAQHATITPVGALV